MQRVTGLDALTPDCARDSTALLLQMESCSHADFAVASVSSVEQLSPVVRWLSAAVGSDGCDSANDDSSNNSNNNDDDEINGELEMQLLVWRDPNVSSSSSSSSSLTSAPSWLSRWCIERTVELVHAHE